VFLLRSLVIPRELALAEGWRSDVLRSAELLLSSVDGHGLLPRSWTRHPGGVEESHEATLAGLE